MATTDSEGVVLGKAESLQMAICREYTKLDKAYRQLILLNNQSQEIEARYDRIIRDGLRNYRYLMRLRLCSTEGLRNVYNEYVRRQTDKISDLEGQLRKMGVEPIQFDAII